MLGSLIFLVSTSATAAQIHYFISSSEGADTNDGRSPATAWRSLERASAPGLGLGPGAAILLRAGDEWRDRGAAWYLTDVGGTASQPLVISSYGVGPARPRIVRNASASQGPTLTINNASGVAVRGLEIVGGEVGIAFTNDLREGESETVYDFFEVSDCAFHHINGLDYDPNSGNWWGSAVAAAAKHAGVTLTNFNVSHNLCNASDVFYINSVPWQPWTRSFVAGLTVEANTISYASFNTLFLDTTAFVSIRRNVFLHDTPRELFVAGTTDIIMGTLNASVRIEGNEISFRGEFKPGGPDGCAVDFETFADGVQFVDNFVYGSYGAGIMVFGHGQSSINLVIDRNTMLYNGCNQTRDDHGGIAFMFANSSGTISNGVFATCPGVPLFYARVPGADAGWIFSSNTVDGVGGVIVSALSAPTVESSTDSQGNIVLRASCPDANAEARYTADGSRPREDAAPWPVGGGALTLPSRTVAIVVKCFPPAASSPEWRELAAARGGATVLVESPAGGGIFAVAPI